MLENTDIKLKDMMDYVDEGYIVMVLEVNDCYEYYVRDNADRYAFMFMFAVYERSFSMCEVAISQFRRFHEDDTEIH